MRISPIIPRVFIYFNIITFRIHMCIVFKITVNIQIVALYISKFYTIATIY